MGLVRWLCAGFGLVLLMAASAHGQPMSDAQVRQAIIREAIRANGGYCVCPWQKDRKGKLCAARSLYNRPGGFPPQCYAHEIDDTGVEAWLNEKQATRR
jgi:hypothetical protein